MSFGLNTFSFLFCVLTTPSPLSYQAILLEDDECTTLVIVQNETGPLMGIVGKLDDVFLVPINPEGA
jgi:hypothetical protein